MQFLKSADHRFAVSSDYNNVIYKVERNEQDIKLSFNCFRFKDIFNLGGKYFLEKYYKDYQVEDTPEAGFDITISFNTECMKKT